MKRTLNVASVAAFTLLLGCATSPDKLPTASVSSLEYRDYSCEQVAMEMERVTDRTNELHGTLKKKADNDTAQMAVGMLLFWPTLFFLEGGDGPEATEYSRLKGERDALEKVAVEKQCDATVPTVQEVPAGEADTPPLQEASTPAEAG
ncbi:MAG: metal ABC transporter ATP-binding protein [Gammaproteobacteria bacterium]|nr:metal ABC transporter ATP-binding protein [Gammaproteobacteria bacterium]